MKKKKKEKSKEQQIVVINNIPPPAPPEDKLRAVSLYGDISESYARDIIGSLLYLENTAFTAVPVDPADPESEMDLVSSSIKLYVSTNGGSASDMFAILDIIEKIKKDTCDVETYGIGKVYSAGVPILASGTKGKRKIGKNCRIMLHNITAGSVGTITSMENELEEIKWIHNSYIESMAKYTKLTKAKLTKLLKTQKDVYLSSEDAIKYGIADEIV